LAEKAIAERIPYDLWHANGFLQLTPGKTISYEFVAHYLRQMFQRYNIQKLAFDRWNFRHLQPWLLRAGFGEQLIKERFVEFGQGVASNRLERRAGPKARKMFADFLAKVAKMEQSGEV
jgi:phage terminase large subunit-like protein